MVRWPSGRRRTPGKCVSGNASRVRIPPSPPLLIRTQQEGSKNRQERFSLRSTRRAKGRSLEVHPSLTAINNENPTRGFEKSSETNFTATAPEGRKAGRLKLHPSLTYPQDDSSHHRSVHPSIQKDLHLPNKRY